MKGAKVLAGLKGEAATWPPLIREPADWALFKASLGAGGRKEPTGVVQGLLSLVPALLSAYVSRLDLFLDILVKFSLQSA